MSQNTTEEKETKKLVSLKDFIEDYQKIIAVIGVFIALALFWKNLQPTDPTPYISYLCILITVPLLLEVRKAYDYDKSSWNLVVFINVFYGIFFLTIYYLIISYPNYLEKIFTGVVFALLLYPSLAVIRKFVDGLKVRDYESRLKFAKALEENDVPLAKRNEMNAKENAWAARFSKRIDIGSNVFAIILLVLSLAVASYAGNYIHASFDVILDRTPEMDIDRLPQ